MQSPLQTSFQGFEPNAALKALIEMVRPGGLVLVGEPFWRREPAPAYLTATEMNRDVNDVDYETILLYPGNYQAFVTAKQAERDSKEAEIEKQEKQIADHQAFVDRFRAKASKARQAQSKLRLIEKIPESEEVTSFVFQSRDGAPLPSFSAGQQVLHRAQQVGPLNELVDQRARAVRAIDQNTVDFRRIIHEAAHSFRDRAHLGDAEIGQRGLELGELATAEFLQNFRLLAAREGGDLEFPGLPDVQQQRLFARTQSGVQVNGFDAAYGHGLRVDP